MLKRTTDNRLIFSNGKHQCELLSYCNQSRLNKLKKELLCVQIAYHHELFGLCPFIFLDNCEYRVLKLASLDLTPELISQRLKLNQDLVNQTMANLGIKYRLWAFDKNWKNIPETLLIKVWVNDFSFSQLLSNDDLDDLEEILPNDQGKQANDSWSNFAASDVLNCLTPLQRRTAILLEQGYTPEEIGRKLGVCTQEVYQKIIRMRKHLLKLGYQVKI